VHINRLKYTTAVFKEAMRLYPPAPVTARHTVRESKIGDFTVPADVLIYIPIWWVQRSSLNWDNPDVFDPTRFLNVHAAPASGSTNNTGDPARHADRSESGKNFSRSASIGSSWIPFSGGQRNCVGQRFAMMEGPLILAKMVAAMEITFPEGFDPMPISTGPVQKPGVPMRVTLRERSASERQSAAEAFVAGQ
jgi:cytochrome P450